MSDFIKIKASANSISNRKSIQGVGINDAWYMVNRKVNGKRLMCPIYQAWYGMIVRCYSEKYHKKRPTYLGCSMDKEWLRFSVFEAWANHQPKIKGMALDKDIRIQGNKHYSAENCQFVTPEINSLLTGCGATRGEHPQGVSFDSESGKYISQLCVDGKGKKLGRFYTPELAFEAYKKAKYENIKKIAMKQCEPLRSELLAYEIN